jgi:inner membrane protein
VDNLTHSLVGAVLAQTGLKAKTRKGTAALILGANAPDIDVFLGWVPWTPLATHRGFTHGFLAALLIMPALVTGFLWSIDRWQVQRRHDFGVQPAMDWCWLLGLSLIGCATHPLLDWQTTYAVQLYSPFSTRWYHVDTLFIVDIWIWILLGGALWLSLWRERRGGNWSGPALTALGIMLVYISGNAIITESAKHQLVAARGEPGRLSASPPPVVFYRRQLVWLDNAHYGWANYDPLDTPTLKTDAKDVPVNFTDPLVRQAVDRSPEVQAFLRWSIMPTAFVARIRCTAHVTFNDARYLNAISRGTFERVVEVPLYGAGCL